MNGATTAAATGERYAEYWPGYRSMWWYGGDAARPLIAARGVYGQTLYLDPAAEVVMVRLSSHPVASNVAIDPGVQPVYRAIADTLFEADSVAPEQ
jgi:CubicO group peptidase (beta-lactamase class C family)